VIELPADCAAAEQIDPDRQVSPARCGADVGDVARPAAVWCRGLKVLLVQAFIKEAAGRDLRCFVVGGKVAAAIERRAAEGEYSPNLHRGGTARMVQLDAAEKQMAVKACKVLGLDVAGVGILRSHRSPLLLELNSSPGLEGIETATGMDLAGKTIQNSSASSAGHSRAARSRSRMRGLCAEGRLQMMGGTGAY
jgi:hypothetical protein